MTLFFLALPPLCALVGLVLLIILAVIDLREYLLPNRYVFPFGGLGLLFHSATGFEELILENVMFGALLGGGVLLLIRWIGGLYYKQEAMGLGDVKLMTAAGLWLGPASTMMAMTMGAMAGLFYGIGVAFYRYLWRKQPFSLHRLVIPAGPGFIVGIIMMIGYDFGASLLSLATSLIFTLTGYTFSI